MVEAGSELFIPISPEIEIRDSAMCHHLRNRAISSSKNASPPARFGPPRTTGLPPIGPCGGALPGTPLPPPDDGTIRGIGRAIGGAIGGTIGGRRGANPGGALPGPSGEAYPPPCGGRKLDPPGGVIIRGCRC